MSAPCPIFGFLVWLDFQTAAGNVDRDAIVASLVDMLTTNGLTNAGHGGRRIDYADYAVSGEGGQATNADRELVMEWAARWTHVVKVRVSDLVDLSQTA